MSRIADFVHRLMRRTVPARDFVTMHPQMQAVRVAVGANGAQAYEDYIRDRVAAGGKAIVKIGSEKLEGTVSSVTPLSKNGVISFTVQLNEDNNRRLRSGLKTDVYVMNAVKEDVMRIANASYYVGRGEYELFVRNSDKEIVKRKVQLGDSNFEFVEVIGGLQPGDEVVVSDMSQYKNKNKLKLK